MNVVFDLGGVVLTWDPPAIVSSVFDDAGTQALVLKRVFAHPDWLELDRGTLSPRDAIERAVVRTGIDQASLERLFNAAVCSLVPVPEVVKLISALRAAGNRLFVLSNLQPASLVHVDATYGIFALFDGRVVSFEVGLCKPEPAIYRLLLATFAIAPEETVLVDDVQANLDTASAFGMRTVLFTSTEACRAELIALGCL